MIYLYIVKIQLKTNANSKNYKNRHYFLNNLIKGQNFNRKEKNWINQFNFKKFA